MKYLTGCAEMVLVALVAAAPVRARAQHHAYLNSSEVEKLRDTQDPSERIKVYLSFEQDRLNHMEAAVESNGDVRMGLGQLLNQYISIDDELKDWIQYQYDHGGDMRKGLRKLLDVGPRQLEILRHFQNSQEQVVKDNADSLRDAIADMNDTLNGATQALAVQQKKFPEMKQAAKTEAHDLKKERKEQEKLNRKERKMRKKHRKKENPDDSGKN